MFETFDHTADLGLRIRAATLNELFADAGVALFSTIVVDLSAVRPTQPVAITVVGDDREYLLFDWLNALLYRFDSDHVLFCRFDVQVSDTGLAATAWGEPQDWDHHVPNHEVKAITYHGLKVEQTPDGWLAEVIVDI